jgi:predicted nucleotidyltransferase
MRWPEREFVLHRLGRWAEEERKRHPRVKALGYFGSYARGDAGVGSDLDLVAVVGDSGTPFERRSLSWDLSPLPVPAEILIYTEQEWRELLAGGGRFARMMESETIWL